MFEKNLSDLIRGIRAHPDDETKYISNCMDECRKELKNPDLDVKANAIAKLTYLQMLGFDISWASFQIVEVMTSKKFLHKRIGYLAAAQSFHEDTDVLMLTTNMLKKGLTSQNMYEVGLALNGLSNFMTPDLARDLGNDVITLMTSVRPYVRKKATLCTYPLFLKYPEALRAAFPRLKDKLEDSDPAVQSAAVSVICELARKNPKNYLSLAPTFFKILNSSQNNWMRIKIIKLFAALCPLEPRLAKKLADPLTDLINSTPAMSLLYECIQTVLSGMPEHVSTLQLCVQKLRIFIEDHDQNLKYLGLQAMAQVLKIQPKAVLPHRDLIIECLDDRDESIRLRALDLLAGMVNKKTLVDIVRRLLVHLENSDGASYRDEVVSKIVDMSAQNHYQFVVDFKWYVQVLIQLTRVENTRHGRLLATQLMDVAIRVKSIRDFAVPALAGLLQESRLFSSTINGINEVLYASAFVVGEYAEHLTDEAAVVEALLQPRVASLPAHIQAVCVHNTLKIYARLTEKIQKGEGSVDSLNAIVNVITSRIPLFVQSGDLEVQERAVFVGEMVGFLAAQREKGEALDHELLQLFAEELNPVAPKAQRKVPVPEGLDLDEWINTPPASDDEADTKDDDDLDFGLDFGFGPRYEDEDEETRNRKRQERLAMQQANPYHLGGATGGERHSPEKATFQDVSDIPVEQIPIDHIEVQTPLYVGLDVAPTMPKKKKKKKLSKKEKKALKKKGLPVPSDSESEPEPSIEIQATEEMPDGVADSDPDDNNDVDDPHRALDIDLDAPMDASEMVLPTPSHHVSKGLSAEELASLERQRAREARKAKKKADKDGKKKKKKKSKEHGEHHTHQHEHVHEHEHEAEAEAEPANVEIVTEDAEPEAVVEVAAEPPVAEAAAGETKKKSKKDKKDKKDKKKKKHKHHDSEAPSSPSLALRPLVKGDHLASAYAISGLDKQVQVTFVFQNIVETEVTLKSLHIDEPASSVKVASQEGLNEPQTLGMSTQHKAVVTLSVEDATKPVTLTGKVEYATADTADGELAFEIALGCSTFFKREACSTDRFTEQLSSGSLSASKSEVFSCSAPFAQGVHAIHSLGFAGVEFVDQAASLFGESVNGDVVCILAKDKGEQSISIDFKASAESLIDGLVSEIRAALAK
ncbi:uncharacterized protein MONBRDRAFT_30296 [Monosiga brevicollis MX1]|uniref:AP-3 complex subunit delta n=1 Tax=Monosiga brevicollis TaxID=81824 RepID=A9VDJ9_MONBE|nr:uncharacterized protein MONBRDRAFT_30296 [Monosiga brevicollis MX1]EDQ84380.1 predicted protein [Monosiga brevicollis MX1]|eukprot:XP_001750781.1 hypothetical protein [Monosiga brevicollis MX1]